MPVQVADSSWAHLEATAARYGLRLARLEQLLEVSAGRRVVLEVKTPPPAPGAKARTAAAVAGRLRSLQQTGVTIEVTVSSFSAPLLAAVRALLIPGSGVRTALLGRPQDRVTSVPQQALDAGHDEVHHHVRPLLSQLSVIEAAHGCGVAVVPWTVNSARDVRRLEQAGVDAVITDVPTAARAAPPPTLT